MNSQFIELYKLSYEKIIESSSIIYKTLGQFQKMAFSLKELRLETSLYLDGIVILTLIEKNLLDLETFNQIIAQSFNEKAYKQFKLKKCNDIIEIKEKIQPFFNEYIKTTPKFIKLFIFFDKVSQKKNSEHPLIEPVFIKSLASLIAYSESIDYHDVDAYTFYKHFITQIKEEKQQI